MTNYVLNSFVINYNQSSLYRKTLLNEYIYLINYIFYVMTMDKSYRYFIMIAAILVFSAGYVFASSVGSIIATKNTVSNNTENVCGNGILENGEECDGSLNNKTCNSYGFVGGLLVCKGCVLDTINCVAPTGPAGQLYGAPEEGIKLNPIDVAIIVVILVIAIGGILYSRYV